MFNGHMKAVTFSYDDGVLQDTRLIALFNEFGLKATFNLNSQLLGTENTFDYYGKTIQRNKVNPEDVRHIYKGHEIAVHTLSHPNLTQLADSEVIRQVEQDRVALTKLAGYEVRGMAYPCGGVNNDDRVASIIKSNTGVKYARTIASTHSFRLQSNLYRFNPTVHHEEWDKLQELVREFVDLKPTQPALFYIWGHSYEFDIKDTWEQFRDICKDLGGRNDIFYGTNRQVLL